MFSKRAILNTKIDVAVVGGGAAGMAAALFLSRANRSVLVFDEERPRNESTPAVREFLGFNGLSPEEVRLRWRTEFLSFGGKLTPERVDSIRPLESGDFEVRSAHSDVVARSVVLATGLKDILPELPGLRETWGRGTCVCPCFSGFEAKGKRIAAFGLPQRLPQLGKFLTAWSPEVTVVSPAAFDEPATKQFKRFGIQVVPEAVAEVVVENGVLKGLKTVTSIVVPCEAVYIAAPMKAASTLAADLCQVDADGFAIVDKNGATSRPGVYAVGNSADPLAHLAQAAAQGTHAGPYVNDYLLNLGPTT